MIDDTDDAGDTGHELPAQFRQPDGSLDMPALIKAHGELSGLKKAEDERRASLPQTPDAYKVEFKPGDDFRFPEGVEGLQINEKDPRIAPLREFALKHGLSQDQVNGLVGIYVKGQLAEMQEATADIQANMAALGENGKARVDAADAFLKAHLAPAERAELRNMISDRRAFAGLEKLIAKAMRQGVPAGASFDQHEPRKPPVRPADVFYGGNGAAPSGSPRRPKS